MATTGISALGNDQIIAIAALSSKTASTAEYTTGGNGLQSLYDTVHDNSGSWTGGGGGADYTAGAGIDITNNVISVTGKENTITYGYSGDAISSLNGHSIISDPIPYEVYGISASANISAYESDSALWISGRDWTPELGNKLDSTAQVVTSTAGDGTYVTAINGMGISGQGGGGGGGGGVTISTAQATRQDSAGVVATAAAVDMINNNPLMANYLYMAGVVQRSPGVYQLDISPTATMFSTADRTGVFSPLQYATGAGLMMSAGNFKGYAKANEIFVSDSRYGYARVESHGTRGNRIVVQSTGLASAQMSARGNTAQITLGTTDGTAYIDVTKINQWDSAYGQLGNVTALLDSL